MPRPINLSMCGVSVVLQWFVGVMFELVMFEQEVVECVQRAFFERS